MTHGRWLFTRRLLLTMAVSGLAVVSCARTPMPRDTGESHDGHGDASGNTSRGGGDVHPGTGITFVDSVFSSIDADGFTTTLTYLGDTNQNATLTLHYCHHSGGAACDPTNGNDVQMLRPASPGAFVATVSDLQPVYEFGDTLLVRITAIDPDGVYGFPHNASVALRGVPLPAGVETLRSRVQWEGGWFEGTGMFTSQRGSTHVEQYCSEFTDFATMQSEDLSLHRGGNYSNFLMAPDGQHLLFHVSRQLFVTDAAGANRIALHPTAADASWKFATGGNKIIFAADEGLGNIAVHYIVDTDGSNRTLIDHGLTLDDWPSMPVLNHAEDAVYFLSRRTSNNSSSLYRYPLDGTGLTTVHAGCGDCLDLKYILTPDDQTLIMAGELLTNNFHVLRAADADGSNSRDLSGVMVGGGKIYSTFAPAGSRVIFSAAKDIVGVRELYTVRTDGTDLRKLHPNLAVGQRAGGFSFSPDTQWIAILADIDVPGTTELYVSRTDGTAFRKLSSPTAVGASSIFTRYRPSGSVGPFTSDSRYIYFTTKQESLTRVDLYRARIDTPELIRISPPSANASATAERGIYYPAWDRLLFFMDDTVEGVRSVFTALGDGSNLTKIPMPDGLQLWNLAYSLDGSRLFVGSIGLYGTLVHVASDGSDMREFAHDNAAMQGNINLVTLTPDGEAVVFRDSFDVMGQGCQKIYRLDLASHSSSALALPARDPTYTRCPSGELTSFGSDEALFSADGTSVVHLFRYSAQQARLQMTPLDGNPSTELSRPLATGGFVRGFVMTSDNQGAVYWGNEDADAVDDIFHVNLGTRVRTRLPAQGSSLSSEFLGITEDRTHIFYQQTTGSTAEIWSVDISGTNATRLAPNLGALTETDKPLLSPDGLFVAFRGKEASTDTYNLYIADLAAGTGQRVVTSTYSGPGVVRGHRWSGDSSRVVYEFSKSGVALSHGFTRFKLRSIRIDGSADVELNPAMPYGGTIRHTVYAPAADRIALVTSTTHAADFDLVLVDPDGGNAVNVTVFGKDTYSGVSEVWPPQFSPDGTWVYFIADVDTFNVWELFRVKSDGSGLAKISRPLAAVEDVSAVQITPNGDVVYRVGPVTQDRGLPAELLICKPDGSNTRRLHEPLTDPAERVGDFEIYNDIILFLQKAPLGEFVPRAIRY